MRSFEFRNLILEGANRNSLEFSNQPKLFCDLTKVIKSNPFSMMTVVRFFAQVSTCKNSNPYSWKDIDQLVFEDIRDKMDELSASHLDISSFNNSCNVLKAIFETDQSTYKMIRSNCLELINELIIIKKRRDFFHEPEHVYVKVEKEIMEFSTRTYKSRRLDFFALDWRHNNVCVSECKSDINNFFSLAQERVRGQSKRTKKNIRKNRKQISYFKNFLKKFNARCVDGNCSGYFLTYLNEDSILDHGGTHKLKQNGEEFILDSLFSFVA